MTDKKQIEGILKLDILDCAGIKLAYLDDMRISKSKPLSVMQNILSIDCRKDYILEALGIPKNAVVLSREENEKWLYFLEMNIKKARKETAREIIGMIKDYYGDISVIARIAKQYGCEIKGE